MCVRQLSTAIPLSPDQLHDRFLTLLPRIEMHGRIYFRHLRGHKKADAIAEMVALAWQWFVRLMERDKDPSDFLTTFTTFLARAVNSGRRLAGKAKAKDVMNPATQRRHGFTVEPLPCSPAASHDRLYSMPHGQEMHDAFEERLQHNTVSPVPEQAAFRIDFPRWRRTRCYRDRRILDDLMAGHRTLDVSHRHGLSPARVSQLRREFHSDWERFTSEPTELVEGQVAA